MTRNLFLAFSSPETRPNPIGHEKKGPQKQGRSSFLRTRFVHVYKYKPKDILVYMKTISVYRPEQRQRLYRLYRVLWMVGVSGGKPLIIINQYEICYQSFSAKTFTGRSTSKCLNRIFFPTAQIEMSRY